MSEIHTRVLPWNDAGPRRTTLDRSPAAGGPAPDDRNTAPVKTTRPSAPDPDRDVRREPRSATGHDPDRDAADPASGKGREAPARLSLTQVLASSLAAVSTTVLLSYFGTAGTIVGAGIASALTVVANYVYTRSIQKTREQLVPVVGKVVQVTTGASTPRGTGTTAAVAAVPRGTVAVDDRSGTDPAVEDEPSDPRTTGVAEADEERGPGDEGATTTDVAATDAQNPWLRLVDRYGRGRVLTVTALALFVVVMGVVLLVELVIGKPISDAVRGVEGSGTTISTTRSGDTTTPTTPTPSTTIPAEDPTTVPTHEPAPDVTPTDEPTLTPTEPPTESPTTDPTTPPTETPTPGTGTGEEEVETGAGTGAGPGTGTGTGTGTNLETAPTPARSTPTSS